MGLKRSGGRVRKPVRRGDAEKYLRYTLLSFALTVTLIRLFLAITGYPQLGGGEFHIAHVLWGGLALFSAVLLSLILTNRWAYSLSAILAGIGVGLFIDEVGKFITQNNDYFYPAAAPIIYAFFLLMVWLYLHVRRPPTLNIREELYRALGEMGEVLDHDLESEECKDLENRLERIAQHAEHADYRRLARRLQEFIDSESLQVVPDRKGALERLIGYAQQWERRWITLGRLKAILIGALLALGIVTVVDFARLLSGINNPEILTAWIDDLLSLGLVTSKSGLLWFATLTILEGLVGLLLITAILLLLVKREDVGLTLAAFGLLLSLVGVDLLVFYFRQFSTIITALIQFLLLLLIYHYRSRNQSEKG
ncbi:MAG: hypothetical protein KAS80_02685 [Anaerolineales bacterium]|nr:hypothetical protein [Anaerolineales bacterium]